NTAKECDGCGGKKAVVTKAAEQREPVVQCERNRRCIRANRIAKRCGGVLADPHDRRIFDGDPVSGAISYNPPPGDVGARADPRVRRVIRNTLNVAAKREPLAWRVEDAQAGRSKFGSL